MGALVALWRWRRHLGAGRASFPSQTCQKIHDDEKQLSSEKSPAQKGYLQPKTIYKVGRRLQHLARCSARWDNSAAGAEQQGAKPGEIIYWEIPPEA